MPSLLDPLKVASLQLRNRIVMASMQFVKATKDARAGADVIDVSGGLVGHIHPENKGLGFFVPQSAAVKKAVDVPVIGIGGIKTPEEADEIIRSGKVDLIAIGRAILNDPLWASKAIEALTQK